MSEKRLVVSLPGREVGTLAQERSGLVRFTPESVWDREQEPRLGLDFLRTRGPRTHASELPSWFENLLPEPESELRRRLCARHGLRDGQSFALMRALGRDLIGAVELREENAASGAPEHDAAREDRSAEMLGDDDPSNRLSALTGMQLKFSMSMVNERLTLPARGRGAQWIVKIARGDYEELAEVETATMSWARASGFDVPAHFQVPVSELDGIPEGWVSGVAPAFAIRRFDRREDGSRVHQEDLCQALALRPAEKYGDRKGVTFDGAIRLVVDACGDDDGHEFARRIGFMIASGNTDAHLKNWSLLWGERSRPTLTPCYDLVATISWRETLGWGRKEGPALALPLGGERLFRRLSRPILEACARRTATWVTDEILAGIERARNAWPDIRHLAPRRMSAALEEHWRSVPLLTHLGALE